MSGTGTPTSPPSPIPIGGGARSLSRNSGSSIDAHHRTSASGAGLNLLDALSVPSSYISQPSSPGGGRVLLHTSSGSRYVYLCLCHITVCICISTYYHPYPTDLHLPSLVHLSLNDGVIVIWARVS
jgi:hypothetical protein